MKKITKFLLFMCVTMAVISFSGCFNDNETNTDEVTVIRIAQLIDDANPQSGIVFEDFRQALEDYLGIPVEGITDTTHVVAIEAMRSGNLEIMWGSPFVYLLATGALDVERLVVTDNENAINKGVFITAHDDIHTLADLEGRSFSFINPSSASGFLYPAYHLINAFDLTVDELLVSTFFSSVHYAGAQDASVMGVIHGDFDAGIVGNLNLQSFLASGLITPEQIRIIDATEIIPFPGYIATKTLPEELRTRIANFMIAYDNTDYFMERFNDSNTRFVHPNEAAIDHLRGMVEVLDIDLEAQ